jgi:PAS domain S-box-containing protein
MNDQDKTKQQLLDESAELRLRLDALANNLPEGFMFVDTPDMTIRNTSRYGREMFGVSRDEIEGIRRNDHFQYYRPLRPDGSEAERPELPLGRALFAGEVIRNEEWLLQTRDGRRIPILCHAGPVRNEKGEIVSAIITWQDISERKRTEEELKRAHAELEQRIDEAQLSEARLEAVLQLNRMAERPLKEITDFALEHAVALTKSKIGYFAFMNDDETVLTMHSWSKEAMKECAVSSVPLDYPLETTGLWGEAARQRKPVVTNDYSAASDLKKGLPAGHVKLVRHMNVPIFEKGHIVIVAGVGNKEKDYDESDVRQLTLLMEGVWTLIQRQRVQIELQRHRDHLEQLVEERTEALQQSRDELQAVFDGMADGLAILDRESRKFVRANAAFCRMLGYSEKELLDLSPSDIHPSEEIPTVLKRVEKRFQGERGTANVRVLRKDGSTFSADIASNLLHCRGRESVAGFFRDVTDRIESQEALRTSEWRYRQVFESVTDSLLIVNSDTTIVGANPAACAEYGYPPDEIVRLSVLDLIAPERRSDFHAAGKEIAQNGCFFFPDSMNIRKDGTTFHVEVWGRKFNAMGEGLSLCVVRNIDERKRAEEARLREYRTLKHLLQSSDHERQTIAYEIHDGVAQYLAGAIMQFDVYKDRLERNPAEAAKVFETALSLLRQGHFEVRRLIAGVRPPVLDEAGVVEAIAHLINEQNRQNGPQIEFTSRVRFSRLVPILENAVYRICQEGLANACKHSHSDRVRIRLSQGEDRIRIEIRDWGTGFDPRRIPENRYGLIGIRQRVRLLGGKHRIQSAPDKGTRLTVELPIMEKDR